MIESIRINWVAVALVNVAAFVLGGVWFVLLFAEPYASALGHVPVVSQKPALLFIVGPFFCNLVATLTSASLISALKVRTVRGALAFGALVGVGYVVSTCMNVAINPNFPRPFLYAFVNAPYFMIVSLGSCVVFALMPRPLRASQTQEPRNVAA